MKHHASLKRLSTLNHSRYQQNLHKILFMREELQVSKGFAYKKCIFGKSPLDICWFRDVKQMKINDSFVEMDTLSDLTTAIGRAFSFHVRKCGILDGYDPENPPSGSTVMTCVLAAVLQAENSPYHIKMELRFCHRDGGTSNNGDQIAERDLSEFLFHRLIEGNVQASMTEMKMKYIYRLKDIQCFVNELELML